MNQDMLDNETPQAKINRLVAEEKYEAALNDMGWSYGTPHRNVKTGHWQVQIHKANNTPSVLTAQGDTIVNAFKAAYTLAAPHWTPPNE